MDYFQKVEDLFLKKGVHVLAAFAGLGKTFLAQQQPDLFIDLDGSPFHWKNRFSAEFSQGIRLENKNFITDYLCAIQKQICQNPQKLILISRYEAIREALAHNNIPYALAYPEMEAKEQFIERYRQRGSYDYFIKERSALWDCMIQELDADKNCAFRLRLNGYLSDIFSKADS